jgi:hypothetical protein
MTSTEVAPRSQSQIDALSAVNAELTRQLLTVPDAPDDGGASMFLQLLGAKTWMDLDAPWSAQGLAKLKDKTLLLLRVHKMPSDVEDGPGWYLVVDAVDKATGEEVTFTTSSVAVMIQLLIMHVNGWWPMTVIPRVAKKPTKRGFYPQHLEIVDGPAPARAAAGV